MLIETICQNCRRTFGAEARNLRRGRQKFCSRECYLTRARPPAISASRLYRIWMDMNRRCSSPTCKSFSTYGARGISVCEAWSSAFAEFRDWAIANGYEEHLEIDRRDNDLGYSPENCRWVTEKAQANNRRKRAICEA